MAASASIWARRPVVAGRRGSPAGEDAIDEMVEFALIGRRIALEEEVEHRRGPEPFGASGLDDILEHVLGPDHALGPMHFDALVIAVGGPARVRDLADLARCGLQQNGRRVDVAGLADRRIDQSRADRMDLDRLLAEQEARHVEVVDHHIAEEAARPRDVADRRRRRIARQDRHEFDRADPRLAPSAAGAGRTVDRSAG